MIRRHAWKFFVVIALTGLVPAVVMWFSPGSAPVIMAWFGHEVPDAVAESAFFVFLVRWLATILLGSDGLTLFIAVTAFRRGERWAWFAMWYWPIMFAAHLVLYDGTGQVSQAVWVVLTITALIATRPRPADQLGGQPVSVNQNG